MTTSVSNLLIKNLAYYQRGLDLNDNGMAHQCGISLSTLQGIYKGTSTITLTTLDKIANNLGCKPSDLIVDWGGETERV